LNCFRQQDGQREHGAVKTKGRSESGFHNIDALRL
jgi:hypothetical protein